MIFEWFADPTAWLGLGTLILLEVVLGIDNLVFIAILADKLPPEQRDKARYLGLGLAMLMRIVLLACISWVVTLTNPLFEVLGKSFSGRDLILIAGGFFLLFKGTLELHERLEGAHSAHGRHLPPPPFWHVIAQIVVLDAVFSLDSVITAVGMVQQLEIMVIAVVIAMGVMMLASRPLVNFVNRHPTVVILCLGFLLMIGFSLIMDGLGMHIPKGYLYAAIGFSIMVEAINQVMKATRIRAVSGLDMRDRTARAVLRILRGGNATEATEEVAAIVASGDGAVPFGPEESAMIERVLRLGERDVRSIMIPRPDIIWLDPHDTPEEILGEIEKSGRSQFPVCRGDVEEVMGVVHAKHILQQQRRTGTIDLTEVMQIPPYVVDSMKVLRLLHMFKSSGADIAIVVDEHGTIEGLVTIVDILSAITGDLEGAADAPAAEVKQEADGSWLLYGRMALQEVERLINAHGMNDEHDYATLAGFVLGQLHHVPKPGGSFIWKKWTFIVLQVDGNRIEQVRIYRNPDPEEG